MPETTSALRSHWLPCRPLPMVVCGLLLLAQAATSAAAAQTYEVGPGQAYQALGEVPWEALAAGDLVRIHWRPEPYQEKIVIARRGSESAPLKVSGVPGPAGQLPVIDGRDATTRLQLDFTNEARGVIKIGTANIPDETLPSWIVLENLEVRSGRPPYSFTGHAGAPGSYTDNAASVYIESGEHLVLRNLVITDSANGLFVSSQTRELTIEGCFIHENGLADSIYQHNAYTEAEGILYQHNRFGPLRAGCLGNNLKDRSAGTVIRYNWIEGGNRQLDLVDAEGHPTLQALPSYRETFVYGNVLIEPEDAGNNQVVHYGGDSGQTDAYRKGTLYFHHNTVVSTRSDNTTWLRLSTNEEQADCRNNIIFTTAGPGHLALLASAGQLTLSNNWLTGGFVQSHDGDLSGSISGLPENLTGSYPGFADLAAQDFHLVEGDCVDGGTALPAAALPDHAPLFQYVKHQAAEPRPQDETSDVGAFERCGDCRGPEGGGQGDGGRLDQTPANSDSAAGRDARANAGSDAAADRGGGDDGCSCTTGAGGPAGPALCLLLVLLSVLLQRRRS